jgi:hypothetical protein
MVALMLQTSTSAIPATSMLEHLLMAASLNKHGEMRSTHNILKDHNVSANIQQTTRFRCMQSHCSKATRVCV